jgi:mono/diheme cytochrome c family protein
MARFLTLALALTLLIGGTAQAFMAGNPKAGRSLAVDHCAACHTVPDEAVEPTGEDAPGFDAIAIDDNTYTLNTMRDALESPHWPDGKVTLTSKDADNVIAFIVSLRPK